jgi:hypothetical protein
MDGPNFLRAAICLVREHVKQLSRKRLSRLVSNDLFGGAGKDESGVFDVLAKDDGHTIDIA